MAQNPAPPRPGGPPRPKPDSSRARPSARPRPKMGGKSWQPGDPAEKPKKLDKPKLVRSPAPQQGKSDEHLSMVQLSGDKTGTYDTGKKDTTTSFFAIPGANKKPAGGPPVIAGPSAVAAPVAPIAGPVPIAPVGMGPQPVGGIAGPVAAGMGGAPGAPMAGAFNPAAIQEERSTSSRVFVMVAVLVIVVCMALVTSVGLLLFAFVSAQQEEPLALPTKEPQGVAVVRPPVDTGVAPTKPSPAPAKRIRPRSSPKSGTTKTKGSTKPAPAPVAPAGPTGGTLSITKPGSEFLTGFEIRCNEGFRRRAKFSGNTASVADVPAEACTVTFKGGAATPKLKVVGGGSYRCTGSGSSMYCKN